MSWLSSGWDALSTSNQSATQNRDPWKPAQPVLNTLLGGVQGLAGNTNPTPTENNAFSNMLGYANAGNPYASSISDYAKTMLAGGGPDRTGMANDAYQNYMKETAGTANGDYLDPNKNPFFAQTTQTIGNDIQNRVNGMFAGGGREMSGMNQLLLSRGLAEGTAPIFSNIYEQERQRQEAARTGRYQAGGQTTGLLSGLDQTRLGNMGTGVGAAGDANSASLFGPQLALQVEAARRGIPVSLLQQLSGITTGIAGLGGTSTTTGTSQKSPLDMLMGFIASGNKGQQQAAQQMT